MTMTVQDLEQYINSKPIGARLNIATSQYAGNTTRPGFYFNAHSSAPAVRSLINKGLLSGWYAWRYYAVVVEKHSS